MNRIIKDSAELARPPVVSVPWCIAQLDEALDFIRFAAPRDRLAALGLLLTMAIADQVEDLPTFEIQREPSLNYGQQHESNAGAELVDLFRRALGIELGQPHQANRVRFRQKMARVRVPSRYLSIRVLTPARPAGNEPDLLSPIGRLTPNHSWEWRGHLGSFSSVSWASRHHQRLTFALAELVAHWVALGKPGEGVGQWPAAVVGIIEVAAAAVDPGHWLALAGPLQDSTSTRPSRRRLPRVNVGDIERGLSAEPHLKNAKQN